MTGGNGYADDFPDFDGRIWLNGDWRRADEMSLGVKVGRSGFDFLW